MGRLIGPQPVTMRGSKECKLHEVTPLSNGSLLCLHCNEQWPWDGRPYQKLNISRQICRGFNPSSSDVDGDLEITDCTRPRDPVTPTAPLTHVSHVIKSKNGITWCNKCAVFTTDFSPSSD